MSAVGKACTVQPRRGRGQLGRLAGIPGPARALLAARIAGRQQASLDELTALGGRDYPSPRVNGHYISSLLLQYDASIPAAGTCVGSPCWRANGGGFTYKDAEGTSDGIDLVTLKAGADGKAKIFIKGSGSNLRMDPLYFLAEEGPTVTQLRASNGECWEAQYLAPRKKSQTQYTATDGQ